MKRMWFVLVSFVILGLLAWASPTIAASADVELWKIEPASSDNCGRYGSSTASVRGVVIEGYFYSTYSGFVTWRVPDGYTAFECRCGVPDDWTGDKPGTFEFLLDGDSVKEIKTAKDEKPVSVRISVHGGQSLRVTLAHGIVGEPKFTKGHVNPSVSVPKTDNNDSVEPPTRDGAAPFVVDPNDLEKLATNLRKRVDAKPDIQQRLAKGYVALMTFNLIDIASRSVAQNVAEDLSTRLINTDFNLVERGQLDKALKELKIQDSALIDQSTAQKLGQMTGCNFIVVGSVSDRGQFIVMNARILETATGKAIAAESVECRKITR